MFGGLCTYMYIRIWRLVVLPCLYLHRSKSFHAITQLGVIISLVV